MNILDGLVIPLPQSNLELLNYLLILGMLVFLTYSGVLLGSMILSMYFKSKATDDLDDYNNVLSKEYSDLATNNLTNAWGLGLVPFLAIIFIYTQLLHKIEVGVVNYLIIAFLMYAAALFMIFRYKNSYHISTTLKFIENKINRDSDDQEIQVFDEFAKNHENVKNSTGLWGLVFLFVSLWIFIGSAALAVDPSRWGSTGNIMWLFFSYDTTIKMLQFLTLSVTIAGITYLFLHFYWQKDDYKHSEEYIDYSRRINVTASILFALTQPLFFVLNIYSVPKVALNNYLFAYSIIGMIAIFVLVHFLYAMYKHKINYSQYAFIAVIIVVGAMVAKEKTAFGTINKNHIAVLNQEYQVHEAEWLASLGRGTIEVNAEEIYNTCKACHQAEDSPAAPAHKNVIPKYKGNLDGLTEFILKPTKVNPAKWPAGMPSQGLKPHEAKAVAEYLLGLYAAEEGGGAESPAAEVPTEEAPAKN